MTDVVLDALKESMGQERFRIAAPRPRFGWPADNLDYDPEDFERFRNELFSRVDIAHTVDILEPLLEGSNHRFFHIGLSATCICGWEERKFVSSTAARCAWWEHAQPLLSWDQIEAEYVLQALQNLQ